MEHHSIGELEMEVNIYVWYDPWIRTSQNIKPTTPPLHHFSHFDGFSTSRLETQHLGRCAFELYYESSRYILNLLTKIPVLNTHDVYTNYQLNQ